mmetsp:Transcript_10027/g.12337  ORF Transcript_10027/g.12337 Transcript_10027/m.12337 type:complete len:84 (+) Transcript_10027:620-871(+)
MILIIMNLGIGPIQFSSFVESNAFLIVNQQWEEPLFVNNNGDVWKWHFDLSIPGVITDNSTIELITNYKLGTQKQKGITFACF